MKTKGTVKVNTAGFRGLSAAAKKRAIASRGADAAAESLLAAARSAAPDRTGTLRQAQAVKVMKGTKTETGAVVVQGVDAAVSRTVRLPGRNTPTRLVPARYDRLVQEGTRRTPPNPYRRRAFERTKKTAAAAALNAMGEATAAEIQRQAVT